MNPTNSGSVLEFLSLAEYKEVKEKEEMEKKEKGEEEKTVSAINPLRQPSIGKLKNIQLNYLSILTKKD